MKIYDYPKYYEIAFSFRNIKKEVDFLEAAIKKYSRAKVQTVLELASGNSPYLKELNKRGYRYMGLDSSAAMIRYAKNKARALRAHAVFIKGDMGKFSLTRKADIAIVLSGSLYGVKTDKAFLRHLHSVSRALRKGGLYLLDGVVKFFPGNVEKQSWIMKKGGIVIKTTYFSRIVNKKNNLCDESILLEIMENGEKTRLEQHAMKKSYPLQRFLDLVKQQGDFEIVGSFSDFSIHKKPRKNARNILLLRKK